MKQSERKLPFALTVLSAGLLAAGTAWGAGAGEEYGGAGTEGGMGAQSGAMGTQIEGERPSFSELDLNQDGQINRDEANALEELATNLDQADTDQDGNISESEFSAFEVQQGWSEPGDVQQQEQVEPIVPGGEMQQQEPMGEPGME